MAESVLFMNALQLSKKDKCVWEVFPNPLACWAVVPGEGRAAAPAETIPTPRVTPVLCQ